MHVLPPPTKMLTLLTLLFHKCFIYKQFSHKLFLETAVKQTLEDQNCAVCYTSPHFPEHVSEPVSRAEEYL